MKKIIFLLTVSICSLIPLISAAQCSMCTKTAQQLGEKPAQGLNSGIIYLMLAPLAIIGIIAYRWWKNEKENSGI